jgi:hypothetical protein
MNPFFDISNDENLPYDEFPLRNLGRQQIFAIIGGRRGSDYWGTSGTASKTTYRDTVPEDYDKQFIYKLQKWKPVYAIDHLIEYHYGYYTGEHQQGHDPFLKNMRYVILPKLKKIKNNEVCVELFEQWLDHKAPKIKEDIKPSIVNYNNIKVGSINAPTQFQQNSDHSIQTQQNHYHKEDFQKLFELLKKDIENVDEKIRKDFAMEMDYAVTQLERDRDIKPQLLNMGALIKTVGMGTFTNLLAAPIFELIKPHLGL